MIRALLAFMRKEALQTLRDPRTRFIVFVAPLVQLVVFGYVVTLDVKNLRMGVVLGENRVEDRRVVNRLVGSGVFREVVGLSTVAEAEAALRQNRVDAVWIHRGRPALWINGVNAQVVFAVMDAFARAFPGASGQRRVDLRILYNPELKSSFFMLPGVALMIVLVSVALLSAVALTREKERGTYELLRMTPLSTHEIVMGKLIPYAIAGVINASLVLLLAHLLFHLPLRGSPLEVLAGIVLYVWVAGAVALWVSSFSHTQQQAMLTIMGVLLPMILFSGLFFPIESMPAFFQVVAELDPLTHALRILRGLLLGGFSARDYALSYGILFLSALFFSWLGGRTLRRIVD